MGTGKTLTTDNVTVGDGTNTGNYAVTYVTSTLGTINQANITLASEAVTRTYDATTTANGTATTISGTLYAGDALSGGTFTFDNKNVGTGKTLTTDNVTVGDGTNTGNYAVTYVTSTLGTINQANITLASQAVTRTYDATTTANGTATTISGTLYAGDALSGGTFTSDNKNVGTGKTLTTNNVTVGDGTNTGNYAVTYVTSTLGTINQANITLASQAVTRTYNATTNASGTATTVSGTLYAGDALSGGTFTFDNKNAGTGKTLTTNDVTVGDGTNTANLS